MNKSPKGPCLSLSSYITAQAVSKHFSSPPGSADSIDLLQNLGITRAYVEFYRGGITIPEELLRSTKSALEEAGIQTSGGIATTHGKGETEGSTGASFWLCFTSRKTSRCLEQAIRIGARVFDRIIVDDFLCTDCTCSRCRSRKGKREWSGFRRSLLSSFAEEYLIGPAKEENPEVTMIIKYPQWYDRFHVYGYDVERGSEIFDGVWVGTEIRDPRVDFVHQYQAFSNYRYITSVAGEKVGGAWFDHLWCYPEIYLEQAFQSVLAGSKELVLFSFSPRRYDLQNPNTNTLIDRRELLNRLCTEISGLTHLGVEAYKPHNSDPGTENYIFDYLGMLGIPTLVTSCRPKTRSLILTTHSLSDPDIENFLLDLDSGSTVLATSGFLEGVKDNGMIRRAFGLSDPPVTRKRFFPYRFTVSGSEVCAEERVLFRSLLNTDGAQVLATAHWDEDHPTLSMNQEDDITYVGACLDTYSSQPFHPSPSVTTAEPVSLVHLPAPYANALRAPLLDPLGIRFHAPPKVGLYAFSNPGENEISKLVLENFGDQETTTILELPKYMQPVLDRCMWEREGRKLEVKLPRRDIELMSRQP